VVDGELALWLDGGALIRGPGSYVLMRADVLEPERSSGDLPDGDVTGAAFGEWPPARTWPLSKST